MKNKDDLQDCGTCMPYRGCAYATILGDVSRERDDARREADYERQQRAFVEKQLKQANARLAKATKTERPNFLRGDAFAMHVGVGVLLMFGMYFHVPSDTSEHDVAGSGGGGMIDVGVNLNIESLPSLDPSVIESLRCYAPDALPVQSRAFVFRARGFRLKPDLITSPLGDY